MNLHESFEIAIKNGWTTFKGHKIDSVRLIPGDKRLAEAIEEHGERASSSTTFLTMNSFSILYSGSR